MSPLRPHAGETERPSAVDGDCECLGVSPQARGTLVWPVQACAGQRQVPDEVSTVAVLIVGEDKSPAVCENCNRLGTDTEMLILFFDDNRDGASVCLWCVLDQLDAVTELKISRAVRQWLTQRAVQAAIRAEIASQEEGR